MDFSTLTAALDHRAGQPGFIGLIDGAHDRFDLRFSALRQSALKTLKGLQQYGVSGGDFVVLFVDDNRRFLQTFWAALYGGITPVPLAAGAGTGTLDKLLKVWRLLEGPAVVTTPELKSHIESYAAEQGVVALVQGCITGHLTAASEAEPAGVSASDRAFVQFSSGATGDPKGVVLTHDNILANIRSISTASAYRHDEVALSWMPLTHDMGLIGFHLTMLCNGFDHYIMPTALFTRRPLLWLQQASETRATLLCAPNFGYRHVLRVIENKGIPPVDLSAVRLIYNGAEPIAPALVRQFLERLAPVKLKAQTMFCVYGLAEASLAVTFPEADTGMTTVWVERESLALGMTVRICDPGDDAVELVRLGQAIPDTDVQLAGEHGEPLGENQVGKVLIRGNNVTAGYHGNDAANARAFVRDGWLDTGDLGFFHQGDLVVTGRADEVIFVGGQNYYPQDIEALLVAGISELDLNKIVAAPVRIDAMDTEGLGIFVLHRGDPESVAPLAREIVGLVSRELGIGALVIPVARIPKTTSGKLQRRSLAAACTAGEFDVAIAALKSQDNGVDAMTGGSGTALVIRDICTEAVGDQAFGLDDDLFELGLSSLDLAQIFEAVEAHFETEIDVTDLFDHPTINRFADHLDRQRSTD